MDVPVDAPAEIEPVPAVEPPQASASSEPVAVEVPPPQIPAPQISVAEPLLPPSMPSGWASDEVEGPPPPPPNIERLWGAQWGTRLNDETDDLAIDAERNVIVVGQTSVGADEPGADEPGAAALFVRKLDPDGNVIWDVTRPGLRPTDGPPSVAVDSDGSVVLALSAASQASAVRFDVNGNELWTSEWGSVDSDGVFGVTLDAAGNAYVVGATRGNLARELMGLADAFVSRLSVEGDVLWTYQWGGEDYYTAVSVLVDLEGNLVLGVNLGYRADALAAEVLRLDLEGNELWSHIWATQADQQVFDMALDAEGNLYVGGELTTFSEAGPSEGGFLAKFDADGELLWTRTFDAVVSAVASDSRGQVALSLIEYGDPTTSLVAMVDGDGNETWRTYLHPDGSTTIAALRIDKDDEIVIGGSTYGVMRGQNAGAADAFVLKLAQPE